MFSLSSCSSDEMSENKESPDEIKIVATMASSLELETRAAHNLQGTSLEDPDNIGIYVWYHNMTGKKTTAPVYNGYENVTVSGTSGSTPSYTLTPSQTLGFPVDNADVDVYLYAPYNGSANPTAMCMPHTVSTDQSLTADYVASDFIYGKATAPYATKTANVTMYHAMSKIIFKVVNSGVDPANMTDITFKQAYTATKINMPVAITPPLTCGSGSTTYNVDVASTLADIKVWGTSGTGAVTASDAVTYGVAVIVPPQTTDANAKVSVTIDDGAASHTSLANFNGITFAPGKVYTYNLKLIGTGVTITLVSITDWDDSDSPTGASADLNFSTWS